MSDSVRTDVRGRSVGAGIVGGLVGGVVFGMMMHAMGMIPMVAMLVGSTSVAVGWLVHLAISVLLGALYGLSLGATTRSLVVGAGVGAVYGVVVWVVGALVIMPTWLGMSDMVFVVGRDQWMSLVGHVMFGAVLGVTYRIMVDRGSSANRSA